MNKTKLLLLTFVWVGAIGILAVGYRLFVRPHQEKVAEDAKIEEKKQVVLKTSATSKFKYKVNLALDSFSGYAVFRSLDFKQENAAQGIKLDLVNEPDYSKRLEMLKNGECQMATFTIDALIKNSATLGDMPAVAVCIIDETVGDDAMVAYSDQYPNLDSLDDKDTKFVVTPDSPSETLVRVVMAHFNLDKLSSENCWIKVNGASDVYEKYRNTKPNEKVVFCLWEPYVSKILQNPKCKIVIDSSKFKGYIVDVLVVSRDFLYKNEDVARKVLESYFRVNFKYRSIMNTLIQDDAKANGETLTADQAKRIVKGLKWKNTQENYAHFGLTTNPGYQSIETMISNITDVLIKTNAISADPTSGQPNLLYYDSLIRTLFDQNFHPGFGSEEVQKEEELANLTEEEWKSLEPVGTLQVPRLVFARGTSVLTTSSKETLANLAVQLKNWPQYYLVVRGHCSKEGDVQANQELAKARANTAVEWLIENGVTKNRVKADVSEPNGSTTVAFILGQMPY